MCGGVSWKDKLDIQGVVINYNHLLLTIEIYTTTPSSPFRSSLILNRNISGEEVILNGRRLKQ